MKQHFLVIGLGRFGQSVLKSLANLGYDVVGCDKNPKILEDEELQESALYLVEGDAVNLKTLEELDVTKFDSIIVSMGDDFDAAILIVLALREMGCTNIYAKANDKRRGKGLQGAGASTVIYPEEETGHRVALRIANPNLLQYVQLASHCSGMEFVVPKEFIGESLVSLEFRNKYNALVVMITAKGEEHPIISPSPSYEFQEGDTIFVIGEDTDLERFKRKYW